MKPRIGIPLALAYAAFVAWLNGPRAPIVLLIAAAVWLLCELPDAWLRRRRVHRIDIPGGYVEISGCSHDRARQVADALSGARKRGDL